MRHVSLLLLTTLALLSAPCARAQDDSEALPRDLIHSDLPLYGDETLDKWPRAFTDGDDFGCTSRVIFGEWVFRESGNEQDDDAEWYKVQNYGVFHCFAEVGHAYRREDLVGIETRPSFFVLLGTERVANSELELWTLQMGARPGSDYLLLSRASGGAGAVRSFNVLQTECPRTNARRGHSVDILLTDYCAINTQRELLRLARRMSHRSPLGTLTLIDPPNAQSSP